jgi:FKBP12-rapamycin complex-associated protein
MSESSRQSERSTER